MCLGPPILFVTLSADDNNWPELKILLQNITYEEATRNSSANEQMRKDPLLTSLHFERRWRAFLKYILKGKNKPLGKVNDYLLQLTIRTVGHPFTYISVD